MALRISTPAIEDERVLAAASGTWNSAGTIGTVTAQTSIYVRCACNQVTPATSAVEWRVKNNLANATLNWYKARSIVNSATITFTDATPVDNDDTFVLNGVTYTAKTDSAVAASHQYDLGASNAAAAANLTALLNSAYGPGVTATCAAVSATDVITITATTATVLCFGQGTSASNEIAWADTTLASLIADASMTAVTLGVNSTTAGSLYKQNVYGWPYVYMGIANAHATDPATIVVGVTLHDSL